MAQSTGFLIMRANKEVIFFDAITNLTETYSGSVTKHPLSNGSLITDHTIIENPRFTVSCVLSDADFNISRPILSGGVGGAPDQRLLDNPYTPGVFSYDSNAYKQKQYQNNTETVYPVTITEKATINKILPEVIAQFTKDTIPEAYVTPQEKAKSAKAVKQNLIDMWRSREVFTFLEFSDSVATNTYSNCVFTNVGFKEDATTGDGVFPDLAFEQVTFATTKNISVSINKGRKNGESKSVAGKDNVANAPSSYSSKSVLDYEKATQ